MATLKKTIIIIIAVLMTVSSFLVSCSSDEKVTYLKDPVMTYRDRVITEGEFKLYLAKYKYRFGETYADFSDTPEFYRSKMGYRTGEERLFEEVLTNVSRYLVADYMFESGKFSLSSSYLDSINEELDERDEYLKSEGSSLEKDLSKYGLSRDNVFEMIIRDEKVYTVYSNLKKTGKLDADDEYLASYLDSNYVRFLHLYVNDRYQYETDENGYAVYGPSGYQNTVPLSGELKEEKDRLTAFIDRELEAGTDFRELYEACSEDRLYDRGYYLKKNSDFIPEVIECAFSLEPGQWKKVETEYGTSYVMRLEMDDRPWEDEDLSDFFGSYVEDRKQNRFADLLDKGAAEIEYDREILDRYTVQASGKESAY